MMILIIGIWVFAAICIAVMKKISLRIKYIRFGLQA